MLDNAPQNCLIQEPLYIIYMCTCNITNKSYIGKTITGLKTRWSQHLSKANNGSNLHFHKAIKKYGKDCWSNIVLYISLTLDDKHLYSVEEQLIADYSTYHNGYNGSSGGIGGGSGKNHPSFGYKHTPEAKAKISAAGKGRIMSAENKEKMIKLHTGKFVSQETREKIGRASRGRKASPETLIKMSIVRIGDKHVNYNHTIYTFKHKDGAYFIGTSYDFRKKYNLIQGNLSRVLSGERKTISGWSVV